MANTLIKERTLIAYIPAVEDQPGSPGSPATPERVTWETRSVRVEIPASAMRETSPGVWITPLDDLRQLLAEPSISATQAHYSDSWGVYTADDATGRSYAYPASWTSAWVMRTRRVKVVEPARPAVPPTPPVVGSPARSVYDLHLGWNAGARSVETLPQNWVGTATFDIGKSIGAVVGFTPTASIPSTSRYSFSAIAYGVVVANGIIQVRERGVTTKTIATATGNDTIEARVDGSLIEWRVNGTLVHRGGFSMPGSYALDAVMYAGGDQVDNPVLTEGAVGDPNGGTLLMAAPRIRVAGDGQGAQLRLRPVALLASQDKVAQAALTMGAVRAVSGPLPMGTLRMRPVRVSAAEAANNAFAELRMLAPTAAGDIEGGDAAFVPSYSIGVMGFLPLISGGAILGGGVMEGAVAMPRLRVLASQNAYGESRLALQPVGALAYAEEITPRVDARDLVRAPATSTSTAYVAIVISESIGASGAHSIGAVTLTAEMLEQIDANDTAGLTARIVAAAVEQLGLGERARALVFRVINGQPVLVEDGHAWAVNTETNASTRYENYSFSGMMAVRGRHFGVRANGVYLLDGADDAGQAIESGVALGKHDFGTNQLKALSAVYAGISSTGQVLLRVGDGTRFFTYAARRSDGYLKTQRFDPGRGLRANYFTFDLVSEDGSFELDTIDFKPIATTRKI